MSAEPTRVAAFFDLDRTLIRGSANYPLAIAAFRFGLVPWRELISDTVNAVRFQRHGSTDDGSAALRERILRAVKGLRQSEIIHLGDAVTPRLVGRLIPESAQLLAEHQSRGEDRVVVSASPIEIVGRFATALGLEGAVATRGELDEEGRYTGRLTGEFCYAKGKVVEIEKLAAERGYDLARCYAYSDSVSDLPMLERVGHPVVVNPDRELRALAAERGWPVVEAARKRP
ncbi:HAD-IB family hydrolase [Intrasporangium sp.]|uniref:HAD family hydrolase n=1 Tax=Intrasporangium sp. TaxID=1925024 RepID=UPI0032220474